jgi:hypothetical protein
VKAEFSTSVTVIGLLPAVGSPVEPGPLFPISTVNDAPCCPCEKLSVAGRMTATVGGFSVNCRHQPWVAPDGSVAAMCWLKNRLHVPSGLLPLVNVLANVADALGGAVLKLDGAL